MNKRNIIKIILSLISLIFILIFQFKEQGLGFFILIPVLFLLTIYMYNFKDKITKYKFIYDVILMLLIFFSALILLFLIINLSNIIKNISLEPIAIFIFGGLYLHLKMFIDSIITYKNELDKINDYMVIITSTIINIVFIRYYFDICNIISGSIERLEFIGQNYIYFFVMLLIVEIHKYITNKISRMN